METSAEPSAGEGREQQEEETMIAFFDVETTVPYGSGRSGGGGFSLLEFGAILVCPRRLVEVDSFSTLIRPSDLNAISSISIRCNGISRDSVSTAPYFVDIADKVFSFLHGKVWAGHNILRFDCPRIREAFAEIDRPPPEPKGTVDTLPLLTQRFGRRAGDMKMATLASYFGLGQQKHRSLDDVRMNLEVLKYCAAVLFLESSISIVPPFNSLAAGNTVTESHGNQNDIPVVTNLKFRSQTDPVSNLQSPWDKKLRKETYNLGQSDTLPNEDATFLTAQVEQMKIDSSQQDSRASVGGKSATCSAANSADMTNIGTNMSCAEFIQPDDVLVECITVSHTSHSRNLKRTHILHQNAPLQLCCAGLIVHFGISNKFLDHAGRPKLSILVNAPEKLCHVLGTCDSLVQSSFRNYGSTSEWRPLIRKNAFSNSFTMRLHIPTISEGDAAICSTEMYQREALGNMNKIIFNRFDAAKLDLLLAPGTTIDAFVSLDAYDYQQNSGIRLVAKCLVVHSR